MQWPQANGLSASSVSTLHHMSIIIIELASVVHIKKNVVKYSSLTNQSSLNKCCLHGETGNSL